MHSKIRTFWAYTLICATAVIVFGGVIFWYYYTEPNDYDSKAELAARKAQQTADDTGEVTKGWKTYENANYGLSFKYPSEWKTPVATENKKGDFGVVDSLLLDFKGTKSKQYYADLSKLADYDATYKPALALKKVYTDKKVADDVFWLPPGNAMMMANSKPIYLSTKDEKFRGAAYFANTGQSQNFGIDCLVVMTDGVNILQFYAMYSEAPQQISHEEYLNSIRALTLKDTENQAVSDYLSTFSYIGKSLTSIAMSATQASTASSVTEYNSSAYGFSFSYPNDWSLGSEQEGVIILKSPATQAQIDELTRSGAATEGPAPDITIAYYADIATADMNSPKKYQNLAEMMNDTMFYNSSEQITFANQSAYEAIELGLYTSYTIVAEHGGHIYKIYFNKESKEQLTDLQKAFIDSFKFE